MSPGTTSRSICRVPISETMSVPLFDVPSPQLVASGRIGQIIQDTNFDIMEPKHGATLKDIKALPGSVTESTLISDLIQANHALYDEFLNNCFCKGMAWNILPISAYKHFAKQDFLCLLDTIRFKALRFSKSNFRGYLGVMRTEAKKISSAVDYADQWRNKCINELGILGSEVDETDSNVAEIAYAGFLQNQTSLDDWFSLYVITAPCLYGWNQIAKKLKEDRRTKEDTIFFKTWIVPNLDSKYAENLSKFLEANRGMYDSAVAKNKWNELFRTSLKLELGLFNSTLPCFFPLLRNPDKASEDTIKGLLSGSKDMAF